MKIDENTDKSFYIAGWIVIIIAGIFLLMIKVLGHGLPGVFPPCRVRMLTGYYCPGCGATRSFKALLTGHWIRALQYHAFVPYVFWLGGWFMISQTLERASGHRLPVGLHFRNLYIWIGLGILFGNFLVRDLALYFWGLHLMPVE